MAKVNLSGMSVEALMDLRKRVDEMFLERRAELQKQRIAGKEGPTEISWSVRRDLGRSWRKTSLACCCDQRWQETRRFPDRQVSAEATEKAQVEALSFKLEFMVGVVMYFCSAARDFACLQRQKPAMFAQMPLFVYRHFTGAACTTSSDRPFALFRVPSTPAFLLASGLSNSSDMVRSPTSRSRAVSIGRLFSAPNSKLFAWTTVAIVGAWHAPGRRLEPHARLCVAVAQVVKLKAGCVANSK